MCQIDRFARVRRVERVIRPYLEKLVAWPATWTRPKARHRGGRARGGPCGSLNAVSAGFQGDRMREVFQAWAVPFKGVAGYLGLNDRAADRFAQQGAFQLSSH